MIDQLSINMYQYHQIYHSDIHLCKHLHLKNIIILYHAWANSQKYQNKQILQFWKHPFHVQYLVSNNHYKYFAINLCINHVNVLVHLWIFPCMRIYDKILLFLNHFFDHFKIIPDTILYLDEYKILFHVFDYLSYHLNKDVHFSLL